MPPCARSNAPATRAIAPVNAPFSWPNSSLSISVGVTAPQLNDDERRRAPRAGVVDRAREHVLADAGLAERT